MTTRQIYMIGAYTLTVFVSAFLLFVVQPLAGEMILPLLGGSSAVWTTVMLFFQIMLLVGYIYAHGIAQNFSLSVQVGLHLAIVLFAIFFLPVSVPASVLNTEAWPALYLIAALLIGIGPPTFVVSSSAPLLQHWFGGLRHPDADDPYYLYAASNAGSLLALLSYPFVIERLWTLEIQSIGWTIGFLLLTLLVGGCGWVVFRYRREPKRRNHSRSGDSLPLTRRAWWVLITFIPSSLMLGVTHYLTMDLASVPLLWVIPLALYLLSYILVFARLEHPLWLYRYVLPPALFITFAVSFDEQLSLVPLVVLHLVVFFFIALYFHGRLARDRPSVEHLTGYYICMALGGSLGGVFNALIAPRIFDRLVEYFLVMALAAIFMIRTPGERASDPWYKRYAPYMLTAAAAVYFFFTIPFYPPFSFEILSSIPVTAALLTGAGIVITMIYQFPMLGSVVFGGLLMVGFWCHEDLSSTIVLERSFYGQYEVYDGVGDMRTFMHGTTIHGKQKMMGGEFVNMPTGYYHPMGPFGDLFRYYVVDRVGIAGLGSGGLAPYNKGNDEFHFFEIDPVVDRIAREKFGYLDACGGGCTVHIGDARKLIEQRPRNHFDMLIMDAYTSDAIPTHLLTKQALEIYLSRVIENGLVVMHISNRHFDLERVVTAITDELDVPARVRDYYPGEAEDPPGLSGLYGLKQVLEGTTAYPEAGVSGASGVKLVVIAKNEPALSPLTEERGWTKLSGDPVLWTDSYTNIIPLLAD